MDKIRFTSLVTGLDREVLQRCSSFTVSSYWVTAQTIFIPVFTGALAVLLILPYFTDSVLAKILVPLIWCCVVYLIEKAIVNVNPTGGIGILALSRILMALVVGLIVSTLFGLKLFEDSIEMELKKREAAELYRLEQEYAAGEKEIFAESNRLQQRYEMLDNQKNGEVQGVSGSGHYGRGDAFQELESSRNSALAERDAARETARRELGRYRAEMNEKKAEIKERYAKPGFATRITTLNELSNPFKDDGSAIFFTRFLFSALLLLAETTPMLSCLFNKRKLEYWMIAENIQDMHIELGRQSEEQELAVLSLQNKLRLDNVERQARYKDTLSKLGSLKETYIKIAETVGELTGIYASRAAAVKNEAEHVKQEEIYETTLNSIKSLPNE